MRNIITAAVLAIASITLTACGTTTSVALGGIMTGIRLFGRVLGSPSEKETLCNYYNQHRAEIEAVRAYCKANWNAVPEADKPALLKINDELKTCEESATTPTGQKTTARALLDAFKRAVEIYRELHAAGIL